MSKSEKFKSVEEDITPQMRFMQSLLKSKEVKLAKPNAEGKSKAISPSLIPQELLDKPKDMQRKKSLSKQAAAANNDLQLDKSDNKQDHSVNESEIEIEFIPEETEESEK